MVQKGAHFGLHIENPAVAPVTGGYHPSCGRPLFRLMQNIGLKSPSCSNPCVLLPWIHASTTTLQERETAFSRWASYYYGLADDALALLIMDHKVLLSDIDHELEGIEKEMEQSSKTIEKHVDFANKFIDWSIPLGLWDGTLAHKIEVQLQKCQRSWLPCDGRPPSQVTAALEHLRAYGYMNVLISIVGCIFLPLHLRVIRIIGLPLLRVRRPGPWR